MPITAMVPAWVVIRSPAVRSICCCAAWLDGTTTTEEAGEDWLEFLIGKGVVALNIIPDRNWNITDPDIKRLKLDNLHQVVDLAQALDLPLNVGTEMNSYGSYDTSTIEKDITAVMGVTFRVE